MKNLSRFVLAGVMAGCAITGVFAQSFTAGVRGVVTDESNASIGGAKVVVTDADRGTVFNGAADDAGRYVITALPPGNYILTVETPGFKKFSSGRFTLTVQQQSTVNAVLQVGEVTTTVEVQGSAALVNTTIANLGQVVENKYILSLPNIARNSISLAYLTPGVVGSGGRRGDSNTNFVANGSRNSTSDVLIDGVTVTTVEQNSGITDLKFSPSIDAVQEFKMQTNFFSAEYGQTGGAVVNMVTRSGTNDIHGTAYYFLRDSALNANDWFSNRAGRAIPDFHRDQFGGVIGGPVIRNKTFFFAGYEHTHEQSPFSRTATVPTALQRQGNFSQGDIDSAIRFLTKAMQLDSSYEEPPFFLADLYMKLGKAAEAIPHLQSAIRIRPDYVPARVLLARAWMKLDKQEEALAELENTVKLAPDHPQPHLLLSQIWFRLGNEERARAERELSIKLRRENPTLLEAVQGRPFSSK